MAVACAIRSSLSVSLVFLKDFRSKLVVGDYVEVVGLSDVAGDTSAVAAVGMDDSRRTVQNTSVGETVASGSGTARERTGSW